VSIENLKNAICDGAIARSIIMKLAQTNLSKLAGNPPGRREASGLRRLQRRFSPAARRRARAPSGDQSPQSKNAPRHSWPPMYFVAQTFLAS